MTHNAQNANATPTSAMAPTMPFTVSHIWDRLTSRFVRLKNLRYVSSITTTP